MVSSPDDLTFPNVFRNFSSAFHTSLTYIDKSKSFFKIIAVLSCISAFITIIIVYKASSKLKAEYRNILLAQLTLAFMGCFLVTVVSPFFVLPYPVLFISDPLAINYRFTLFFSSSVVMLYFFPTMLLLSFGLIYNFMSLKQLTTHIFNIAVDRLMKCVIFTVTVVLLTGNCFLLSQLSTGSDQEAMQKNVVQNVDPDCAEIFRKHAAYVFDIYFWPVQVASVEAIALSIGAVILCVVMTALSCKHFERQKPMLSAQAARNHRMMLYMLISYVFHFLIYFAFPLSAFTLAIHDTRPFLGNLAFLLIISPAHCLGISLSVTYCLIITPYRKVIIALVMILTCTTVGRGSYEEATRNSQSLSIIDHTVRRTSFRAHNQVSTG